MSHRNRDLTEIENNSSSSPPVNETLIMATMSLIDLQVEVHLRDASVYSGIFHTASLPDGYGIVLKNARRIKEGKGQSNVVNGDLIPTLVILSGDLVQVVAKGAILPSDNDSGSLTSEKSEAVVDTVPSTKSSDKDVEKLIEFAAGMKITEPLRSSVEKENQFTQSLMPTNAKKDNERREILTNDNGNGLEVEHRKRDGKNLPQAIKVPSSRFDTCLTQIKPVKERQTTTATKLLPNGASVPAKMQNHFSQRPLSAEALPFSGVSTSMTPVAALTSESGHSLAAPPAKAVLQFSQYNKIAKESKLNPAAKEFSPSFTKSVTANLMVPPTVASMGYIPNNTRPIPLPTAQPEVLGLSPFGSHSSVPVKTLPYGNFAAGNIGTAPQFPQPMVGPVGSRAQPVRISGQYGIQNGPGIHPNPQSVMVGRLGPLVYAHPASQGAPALPSPFVHPPPTPHQFQFPKHQGPVIGQPMQLCTAAPSLAATGQPPYAIPCHVPILQPPNRYIPVRGSNGLLNAKFL